MGSIYVNPDGSFEEPKTERKFLWGNDEAVFDENGNIALPPAPSPVLDERLKIENNSNSKTEHPAKHAMAVRARTPTASSR